MELLLPHGQTLRLDHPRIMGILNVTPDSFSDGGRYASADAAVAHGLSMAADGADIIDVGGESTRPGSQPVPADEQKRRILKVIETLRGELERFGSNAVISVDTTSADVAQTALDAGASIINDTSAGQGCSNMDVSHAMFSLAAERCIPIVLMHMQGTPTTMQQEPSYDHVVTEIQTFLLERATVAVAVGVCRKQIMIDPGIGFGKRQEDNLKLLACLDRFIATGFPVLVGASRKRFLRTLSQVLPDHRDDIDFASLTGGTCATTALGVAAGASIFRVHDVRPNRLAADVAWAIKKRSLLEV